MSNRVIKIGNDHYIPDLKAACKPHKCTVNEAMLSIFGQTLKEYASKHNDSDLSLLTITQPVALEGPPQNLNELKFTNTWVCMYSFIPISHDIKHNIKMNKENSNVLKDPIGSLRLLGSKSLVDGMLVLPYNMS